MARAISYARFSHPNQRIGDSLRRQMVAAQSYAARHGLTIDESLRDEGQSAYSGAHISKGALGRLLERVKRREIEPGTVLLVEALDRLSRQDVFTALRQFLDLLEAGIVIVTIADEQRYDRIESGKTAFFLQQSLSHMATANRESEQKSKRLTEAWNAKRERLLSSNEAPTSSCPGWLTVTTERQPDGTFYLVDASRAAMVKRIYELAADGWGVLEVARDFNQQGLPVISRRQGGKGRWSKSTVRYLLTNDAVLGTYQPHTGTGGRSRTPLGDPRHGHYPQIVERSLADRARAGLAMRRNKGAGRKGAGIANIVSGLAVCGSCFSSLAFTRGGGRGRPSYLICSSALRNAGCQARTRHHHGRIEKAILRHLRYFSNLLGREANSQTQIEARISTLQQQAKREAEAEQRLTEALKYDATGEIPALVAALAEVRRKVDQLRTQIRQLEDELGRGRAAASRTLGEEQLDELASLALLHDDTDERTVARRRVQAALKEYVSEIVCDAETRYFTVFVRGGICTWTFDANGQNHQCAIHLEDSTALEMDLKLLQAYHEPAPLPESVVLFRKRLHAKQRGGDHCFLEKQDAHAAFSFMENLISQIEFEQCGPAPHQSAVRRQSRTATGRRHAAVPRGGHRRPNQ